MSTPTPVAPPKKSLGSTIVTDAAGVTTAFSGFIGKFGAAHPRLLLVIGIVVGAVAGWIARGL